MSRVKCDHCEERDAVCVGRYEDPDLPLSFACNECCGHGNEDGFCVFLAATDEEDLATLDQQRNEISLLQARVAALEEQIEILGGETPEEGGSLVH